MSKLIVVDIDPDYKFQGPRFKKIGSHSGEEFRDDYLIPWLEKNKNSDLVVDFNGTEVYTPSFLEECFGGAVRKGHREVRDINFENIPADERSRLLKYIKSAKPGK